MNLLDEIKEEFPKFKIVSKGDSKLMKVIDILLKVITFWQMKTFLERFVTTIGYTVYVPTDWDDDSKVETNLITLRHERVHMRQYSRHPIWFSLSYLLFPVPVLFAYSRMKYEMEAYEETLRGWNDLFGQEALFDSGNRSHMIRHFTSAEYFWTWVWKPTIEKWYDKTVDDILKDN